MLQVSNIRRDISKLSLFSSKTRGTVREERHRAIPATPYLLTRIPYRPAPANSYGLIKASVGVPHATWIFHAWRGVR